MFYQVLSASDQKMIDCEVSRQRGLINHFLQTFYKEVNQAIARNHTFLNQPHKIHLSEHEFRELVENDALNLEFDELPPSLDEFEQFEDEVSAYGFSNLTYKKVSDFNELPSDIRPWLNVRKLRQECKQRHREIKKLAVSMSTTDEEDEEEVEGVAEHLNRYVSNADLCFCRQTTVTNCPFL